MINKYLQHILRKNNKTGTLQECLDQHELAKKEDLKTYLYLIQKRLDIKNEDGDST
jgi:hypothetical protein